MVVCVDSAFDNQMRRTARILRQNGGELDASAKTERVARDDGGAAMMNGDGGGGRRDGTSFISFTYARVGSFSFPVRLLWKYDK